MQNGDLFFREKKRSARRRKLYFYIEHPPHIRYHFILSSVSGRKSSSSHEQSVSQTKIQQTKTLKAMRLFDTKHLLFHRFFMLPIKKFLHMRFLIHSGVGMEYVHGECAFSCCNLVLLFYFTFSTRILTYLSIHTYT